MLGLFKQKWFQISVIILLPLFAYANILANNFVWDDIGFINEWQTPRSFSNFIDFLNGSAPVGMGGVYRPVKIIIQSLDLHAFGFQDALLFHFQGILLQVAITLLIFFIVKKLSKEPVLALITALLFGLSPVHTENVAFATASLDLFGALFLFVSYLLYLNSERGKNKKLLIISLIFAFLATFSNELTFPFFLLLIATDYFIFGVKIRLNKQSLVYLYYLLPILLYSLIRFFVLRIPSRGEFIPANFIPTMLIMMKVLIRYTQVLFLPLNLNIFPTISPGITGFYATENAIKTQSLFDPVVILGITVLVLLFLGIFYFRKKHPVVSFSLAWILISYIPFSNIFPVGILYSERYLYLLSFGFFLGVGYIFFYLLNSKSINETGRKIVLVILAFILSFYFLRTVIRNSDWHDPISFWKQNILNSPDNPDMYNNLGLAYMQTGDSKDAIKLYNKAIKINPNNAIYYNNMGVAYYSKGDNSNAVEFWQKAYKMENRNDYYAIKMAQIYYEEKKYDELIAVLNSTTFSVLKYQADFLNGEVYLNKGDTQKAEKFFIQSIKEKKDNAFSYDGLASVYIKMGKYNQALNYLNTAIKLDPGLASSYNNLAIIYASQNEYDKALSYVNKALEIDPNYTDAQKTRDTIRAYFQQNLMQFLQKGN